MLCDICGKNSASVHLTEIIDEQMTELHLCEECAHKKSTQMEQQFGLSDLLAGLADFEKPKEEKDATALVKCANCGMTYKDFKKVGRLGCGECYITFKALLGPLLKRIHGSNAHCGKTPSKQPVKASAATRRKQSVAAAAVSNAPLTLQDFKNKLQKAVEKEEYEEAAKLRDQIREMEKKQSNENNNKE